MSTLDSLVAIKVLKDEYSQDANFVNKFKMESTRRRQGFPSNIVSVYDVVDEAAFIISSWNSSRIAGLHSEKYLGVKETVELPSR